MEEQQQAAATRTAGPLPTAATLANLPHEMLNHIFTSLAPPDLARLSLVSQRVAGVAESRLWTDVELHQRGWHELCDRRRQRDGLPVPPGDEGLPQRRTRCSFAPAAVSRPCDQRASAFLRACAEEEGQGQGQDHQGQNQGRGVASRVRSLCTVVNRTVVEGDPDDPTLLGWGVFARLTNLERLELHGAWRDEHEQEEDAYTGNDDDDDNKKQEEEERFSDWASAPPLPRLRSAVLYGYLPRNLVRYVLRSAPTLERLELGVLDKPKGGLDDADDDDDDGYDAYWGAEFAPSDAWSYAPRPLALCLDEQGMGHEDHEGEGGPLKNLRFPNLKHLHLCRPTECRPSRYSRWNHTIKYSHAAEEGSTRDWELLVRAAAASRKRKPGVGEEGSEGEEQQSVDNASGGESKSESESESEFKSALETLVLEHRPVDSSETREAEKICNRSFMRRWSGGPAEQRLVDGVLAPVFDEEFRDDDYDDYEREGVSVFPRLREVYLRGMFVGDPVRRPQSSKVPERIEAAWRRLGVRWTACIGQWCLFDTGFGSYGVTEWAPWTARQVDYADFDGDADGADNDHYGDDDEGDDDSDDD